MRDSWSIRGAAFGLTLAIALAASSAAHAAPAASVGPGSALWLNGTSNVHEFEGRTKGMTFVLLGDSSAPAPADAAALEALIRASGVHGAELTVPVKTLHSGKDGLDKNMWKALQADAHPDIRFHLTRYTVTGNAGDTLRIRGEGTLEIAGTQKPDTLEARAWRAAEGVWLQGRDDLRMTSFGVKPPTMMMGTMRVHDPVTVQYRLLLVPGGAANAPSSGAAR
jgi:hypothetical protein